jgi:hypothetical protein
MSKTVMRPSLSPPWPKQACFSAWLPRATPQRVPRRIATTSAQNSAPVDIPELMIRPGSRQHNSLPSFLEYAKRTKLRADKTVYVGTHYEYICELALRRLGFSLLRIGRAADNGIDLIGHWILAPLREPLPVFMQCKARKISANPMHVRELEGSFQGTPPNWKNRDVLGLLVTTTKATKGTLEALGESRRPMGFVLISREGVIQQFLWNRAASERGLEGVGVTIRHTPRALLADVEEEEEAEAAAAKPSKKRLAKYKNAGTRKDIQLTWMGSPIFPDRDNLDQETVKLMRRMMPSDTPVALGGKYRVGRSESSRERRPLTSRTIPIEEADAARPRGRPKGSIMYYSEKLPSPRGGQIPRASTLKKIENRGRPKGARNFPGYQKPGRKPLEPETPEPEVSKKRGRPKGSKNKPKIPVDAG